MSMSPKDESKLNKLNAEHEEALATRLQKTDGVAKEKEKPRPKISKHRAGEN